MSNCQWKAIRDSLRERIESGELAPGSRLPSGQDVASVYGVSRHTANRAIQELQGIGLVVRQRRWGTVINHNRPVRTERVAFLFDVSAHQQNFPSWQIISGIQERLGPSVNLICRECKFDVEEEARLLRKLSAETDGILMYPLANPANTPLIQSIADKLPLVVLDRVPPNLSVDVVTSDNYGATRTAIRALLDKGHRRIGFLSFRKPTFSSVTERYQAFEQEMTEAGVEDYARLVRWFDPADEVEEPGRLVLAIHDSLFTLMHQADPVTAIFCVQDCITSSVLTALDMMHKKLPDHLEIATFNDWPGMMLRRPWLLNRIVQRSYDIGIEAGELLSRRIEGSTEPRAVHRVKADFFIAGSGITPDMTLGGAPTQSIKN